jgi:hypothetical protein
MSKRITQSKLALMVDQLAALAARRREIEENEAMIKDVLKQHGPGVYRGAEHFAEVSERNVATLDAKAMIAALNIPAATVDRFTNARVTLVVRVSAAEREAVAA